MKPTFTHFNFTTLFTGIFLLLLSTADARIIYVNHAAVGITDGTSWVNAYQSLQTAIDSAQYADTICVAAGTYLPTLKHLGTSNRNKTFYINKTVLIYGGFSGLSGTEGDFTSRDPVAHPTILSGDLGLIGDHSDNTFHVVFFDHVSDTTRLDGFTIRHGNNTETSNGAGIYNDATAGRSHPLIANCIIRDNTSAESGGGMTNHAANDGIGNPTLVNCTFINNVASSGGAMSNYTDESGITSPNFINCRFMGNTAPTGQGGAISFVAHSSISSPKFFNCIISGNHSPTSAAIFSFGTGSNVLCPELYNCALVANTGGSLRVVDLGDQVSKIFVRNSIFWNNGGNHGLSFNGADPDVTFSIMQFTFNGEGNFSDNPLFVDEPSTDGVPHVLGDLHLLPGSPAIDAGKNDLVPDEIVTDLDQQPRFVNSANGLPGIIDVGPYEVQGNITSTFPMLSEMDWTAYPNPAKEHITIDIKDDHTEGEVRIMDMKGRMVSFQRIQGKMENTDVSGLPAGTYFIQLFTNGAQDVKKIVIQ